MNGPWHRRKPLQTTHLRDISNSVTILRDRHPFEGRSLPLMGTIKRRGTRLLLVVLPDGSRSLIPASWTDWKATEVTDQPSSSPSIQQRREPCLAPLTDLLRLRVIVDALLGRCPIPRPEPAADEERHHAMDPGLSRTAPARSKKA
jgi:hypothetical protein